MEQADRELINLEQDIRIQKDHKTTLEGQLATLKPNTPLISETGEKILDTSERLKVLRTQYISKSSYLEPDHPDLIKMKREMEALEKEAGTEKDLKGLSKHLSDEKANLASLIDRFGEDHPDVVRSRKIIAGLEKEFLTPDAKVEEKEKEIPAENPAYVNIKSQLDSAEQTLKSLELSRDRIKSKMKDLADRIQRTPYIEQDYIDLIRDRDNSSSKYNEIRSKLMEARVSEGLESEHKGEKFSLIDPPAFPEKPESPNRGLIVVLGFVLAFAGGIGAGAVTESMDHSIRTSDTINRLTHIAPLAVIPYMEDEKEKRVKFHFRIKLIVGLVIFLVAGLLVIHLFWSPLDVIWYVILRRMGLGT
jgi:capsular polysaccharide biosynthesis protein